MSLWSEIRRRNVHRVSFAYVAASWLLIQVVETLFPVFGLSDNAIRVVVILLAVGFVPAVILAWAFDWTSEGLRRDNDVTAAVPAARTRRFDAAIIAILVLSVAYFAIDKFVFDPARDTVREAQVAAQARGEAIQQKYGENSIAVLAFEDISEAGDLEYFAEGISEELLNLLARIPELRVAGRTSAFSFKDSPATIPEIGEALGVTYIVEGSVRTAADRIRITVQLIEAASDTHLFSQNYDRDFDDIFAIQDEVAEKVVNELHLTLLDDAPTTKRVNPRAFAMYLQARSISNTSQSSDDDNVRMKALLEQALELDPNYGEALAMYTRHLWGELRREGVPLREIGDRLRQMQLRTLATDPNNANALNWLSFTTLTIDNDIDTAAAYKKRAHAADPTNYEVLWASMSTLSLYGRQELAARIGEYVIERDPLCTWCYDKLAEIYMELGNYESARAVLRDGLALDPEWQWGKLLMARSHVLAGEPDAAWEILSVEQEVLSEMPYPTYLAVLHDIGRQEEFDAGLSKLIEVMEASGRPLVVAQVYAWIGDKDEAFRWLDKHSREDTYFIRAHLTRPWYRKLYDDPRWQVLLEQYDMTEEKLASLDLDLRLPPGIEP